MKKGSIENKWLVVILASLGVVIVGLIVGLVIANVSKSNDSAEVAVEDVCRDIVVGENDVFEGETVEDAEKRLCQDEHWDIVKGDIESEVARLLESDPVDVDAINRVYNEAIEEANKWGRHDYVIELINLRTESLLSKDLKNEALKALLSIDVSILDNIEKYAFYSKIIDISEKLGRQDLVSKYLSERKEIEADFLAQSEEIRRFTEQVGADADVYNQGGEDEQ